jgi:hypothetical protein
MARLHSTKLSSATAKNVHKVLQHSKLALMPRRVKKTLKKKRSLGVAKSLVHFVGIAVYVMLFNPSISHRSMIRQA